jgi:fibronectin-binding autotransporter adhesin
MALWLGTAIGTNSDDWSVSAFWLGSTLPSSSDSVSINSGNVIVTTTAFAAELSLSSGRSLDIATGGSLSVANNLNVGSQLNDALVVRSGGSLSVGGSINIGGTILGAGGFGTLIIGGITSAEVAGTVTGSIALNSMGSKLVFNTTGTGGSGSLVFSNQISGAGKIEQKAQNSTIILTAANTYSGTTTISSGTLQIGNGGSSGAIGLGVVLVDANGILQFSRSDDFELANVISGQGSLVKSSTGTVTLSAANTYTGYTNINQGAVTVSHASALGLDSNGTIVSNFAALQLRGDVQIGSEALLINGSGVAGIGGALRNLSGDNRFLGDINVASDARINSDSGNLQLSGLLSGTGVNLSLGGAGTIVSDNVIQTNLGTLIKDGSGELLLFGDNVYTGQTIVNAGRLFIYRSTALGATTAGTIVNNGASLNLSGTLAIGNEALTLSGFGVSNAGALVNYSGINSFGGAITLAGATRINARTASLTLNGTIGGSGQDLTLGGSGNIIVAGGLATGTGTLTKDGIGKVTLSGISTYTGQTVVNAGTLVVLNSATLGSAAGGTSVATGATLQFESGGPNYVVNYDNLTLAGSGVNSQGALRNVGSTTCFGVVSLTGVSRIVSELGSIYFGNSVIHSGQTLSFGGAGNIQIAGSLISTSGSFTKDGAGTLTLSTNFNVFNGSAVVNAGILELYSAFGAPVSGIINVENGGTLKIRTGQPFANSLTINGGGANNQGALLSDGGTYSGTIILGSNSVIGSEGGLTISGLVSSQGESLILRSIGYNGNFTLSGAVDLMSGTLTKEGRGTLNITSAQNFDGSLVVSEGWVVVTHATALGSTSSGTNVGGIGTLRLQGGVNVGNEALTINGFGGTNFDGALQSDGNNSYSGAITLGGNSAILSHTGLLKLTGPISGFGNLDTVLGRFTSGDIEISGAISTLGLTVSGTGTLVLSGANSLSGSVLMHGGRLSLSENGTLASSRIQVIAGAQFSVRDNFASTVSVRGISTIGTSAVGDILIGGKTLNITDQASLSLQGNFVGSLGVEGLVISSSATVLDASAATFVDWTDSVDTITLNGNALANTITGTSRADRINGGGGIDRLIGLAGNDVLEGGLGFDTAAYSAGLVGLSILRGADGRYVLGSSQGVDILNNIERLEGSNGSILLGGAELIDRRFGDYDGDGRADISFRSTTGDIAIWRMNGGAFASVSVLQNLPTSWRLVGEGDFNGDGKDDLLWRNNDGQLVGWFMNNATSYSASSGTLAVGLGNDWMVQDVGDYNGDGIDDILWRSDDGEVDTWIMNGLTPTAFGVPGVVGFNWKVQGSGDTDGDGSDDIIWREETTGQVFVWKMNGTTFFAAGTGNVATVGLDWDIAAIADISGDGKADIVWRNNTNGAVHGWIMNGQTITSAGYIGGADLGWHIQGAGDFNGDGKADLMWARTDGTVAFWGLNGLTQTTAALGPGIGNTWFTS